MNRLASIQSRTNCWRPRAAKCFMHCCWKLARCPWLRDLRCRANLGGACRPGQACGRRRRAALSSATKGRELGIVEHEGRARGLRPGPLCSPGRTARRLARSLARSITLGPRRRVCPAAYSLKRSTSSPQRLVLPVGAPRTRPPRQCGRAASDRCAAAGGRARGRRRCAS